MLRIYNTRTEMDADLQFEHASEDVSMREFLGQSSSPGK